MTPTKIPHLCGGILFDLLLEARRTRRKARDKYSGGSDGLSVVDVYTGLIKVVTGEEMQCAGSALRKSATNYKNCSSSKGIYVPFTEPATQSAFDSLCKRKDPDLLERMSGFIDTYLNETKLEWLVRALIETMQDDPEVSSDLLIAVSYNSALPVSALHTADLVVIQPFLLSILNYVVVTFPDCESGRDTFESWYSQSGPRAEWKYHGNVGNKLSPMNVCLEMPEAPISAANTNTASETDCLDALSDREVINNSLLKSAQVIADVFGAVEHQLAEQIRNNNRKKETPEPEPEVIEEKAAGEASEENRAESSAKPAVVHQTVVNQYGDHPVHIDHVENLKL